MAIDFNLLQPIRPQQGVVARLPDNNGLGDLVGGINQGLNANTQRQEMAARTNALNQQTQQQQALAPGQLQEQQQHLQINQNILDTANQQKQDSASLRASAKQGYDNYISQLMQINPAAAIKVQHDKADLEQTYANIQNKVQDTNAKAILNSYNTKSHFGNLASQLLKTDPKTGQPLYTPQQQDAAYQEDLKGFPASIRDMMPAHFDQGHGVNMIILGQIAHADQLEKAQMKASEKGTAEQKPINTLMTGSAGAKQFVTDQTMSSNLKNTDVTLNTLSSQLNSMPSTRTNPVTGKLNEKFDAQTQAVSKQLNTLVLQAPSLFGMSGSALRLGSVWNMIKNSKPTSENWMVANKAMIDDLKYTSAIQQHNVWKSMSDRMDAQALSNAPQAVAETKQWHERNPDPMTKASKPDLTNFYKLFPQAQGQLEQDWAAAGGAPVENKPQESNTKKQQFQEGQVYKDKNGIRAKYINGQWQEI